MGKLLSVHYKVLSDGGKFMVGILFPLEHFPLPLFQSNSHSLTSYSMIWITDIFSVFYARKI